MPLEGLRWSRDSGSALYDTPKQPFSDGLGEGQLLWSCINLIGEHSLRGVL